MREQPLHGERPHATHHGQAESIAKLVVGREHDADDNLGTEGTQLLNLTIVRGNTE
jgi:hypothetical protein